MIFRSILILILSIILFQQIAKTAEVNYIKLTNFKEVDLVKINKTSVVITKILNSKEFQDKVLNHEYLGKKQFFDTKMSNHEVYNTIMKGAELAYKPEPNGNMDIALSMYYSSKNTVGYTYANSDTVWLNRKYHDNFDEFSQPSNIVHEWTHKLGFVHASKWSKSRDYSVPYGIGTIVSELASDMKKGKQLTPIIVVVLDPIPAPVEPEAPKVEPKKVCRRVWWLFFRQVCN